MSAHPHRIERLHPGAMESFATPYPCFLLDEETGEHKTLGFVGIHSVLSFKRFQALISQKTGLAAAALSAVFVCKRTVRRSRAVGCRPC